MERGAKDRKPVGRWAIHRRLIEGARAWKKRIAEHTPDSLPPGMYGEEAKKSRRGSKRFLGLVDIVYAVIIAASFVNAHVRWPGLFSEANAAVALSYGAVVASWIGYHHSIAVHWHLRWVRYPFDLLILYDFWLVFENFNRIDSVLWAFAALIAIYICWTVAKSYEWGTRYDRYHACKDPLIVGILVVLALVYPCVPQTFTIGWLEPCPWGFIFLASIVPILLWYWDFGSVRPNRDHEHVEAIKNDLYFHAKV